MATITADTILTAINYDNAELNITIPSPMKWEETLRNTLIPEMVSIIIDNEADPYEAGAYLYIHDILDTMDTEMDELVKLNYDYDLSTYGMTITSMAQAREALEYVIEEDIFSAAASAIREAILKETGEDICSYPNDLEFA